MGSSLMLHLASGSHGLIHCFRDCKTTLLLKDGAYELETQKKKVVSSRDIILPQTVAASEPIHGM